MDELQEEIIATKMTLEQTEKLNSNLQAKIDDFESQTEVFELKIQELTLAQSSNQAELANKSIDLENMTIGLSQEKKAFSELQESLRTAENSLNYLTLENAKLIELTQTKESEIKTLLEKIRILEAELQEKPELDEDSTFQPVAVAVQENDTGVVSLIEKIIEYVKKSTDDENVDQSNVIQKLEEFIMDIDAMMEEKDQEINKLEGLNYELIQQL